MLIRQHFSTTFCFTSLYLFEGQGLGRKLQGIFKLSSRQIIIGMINQYCQEQSQFSGIETNINSGHSLKLIDKGYKSLDFILQLQKEPDFVDTYTRINRENLANQELANLVQEVTQVLISYINKLVQETFYRQINTLITQVLYIREQLSHFTREEIKQRELLRAELKQEISKLQKSIQSIKKENRNSSMPTFSKHLSSRFYQKEAAKDVSLWNNYELSDSQARRNVEICFQKIEEFRQDALKQQFKITNKLQQVKQKHSSAYNSLRIQLEDILESLSVQRVLQSNVKQNFESIQKLKDYLFVCQKQVTQVKEALVRYNNEGILYFPG